MFQVPPPALVPQGQPAPAAASAAWVSDHRLAPARGFARAPGGSIVTAEALGKDAGHGNLVRVTTTTGRPGVRVRAIGTRATLDPTEIVSTGEAVFTLATGPSDFDNAELLRIRGEGEVPGPSTLIDASVDLAQIVRLDHRRLGTSGMFYNASGNSHSQAATVDARGLHRYGPQDRGNADQIFYFEGASDETGRLIDPNNGIAWRYPAQPTAFEVTSGAGEPPNAVDGNAIPQSTTGHGPSVVATAKGVGKLKVESYARDGSVNAYSEGNALLAIVTPGQPYRTVPVPVPAELTASCRAGSLTDTEGVRIDGLWNGPDGQIWSLIGCAAQGAVNGEITERWLAHWDRATYVSGTVRLPDKGPEFPVTSDAAYTGVRGFAGPNGVMYVATLAGMLAVTGLDAPATTPKPKLQNVRITGAGHRVRAEVNCVGSVGATCLGRVRFADAAGTLGTLRYGVDAGTAAMDPVAVRELAPSRAVHGRLRATPLR